MLDEAIHNPHFIRFNKRINPNTIYTVHNTENSVMVISDLREGFLYQESGWEFLFFFPGKVYTPSHSWEYTRSISLCGLFSSFQNIVYIPKSLDPEQPRIEYKSNLVSCYFLLKWWICLNTEILQDKSAPFGCSCWRNMSIIWLLVPTVIPHTVQRKFDRREKNSFLNLSILITQPIWRVHQY